MHDYLSDIRAADAAEPLPGPEPERAGHRRPVLCGLCGRPLTGAASRRSGLGPSCDAKLHPPGPGIRTRRRVAEQDPIPGT